jgi:hypothetical protein
MQSVVNIISIVCAFVFATGLVYWGLDLSVGRIKWFRSKFEWNGLQVKDFVFLALAAIVVLTFTTFVTPYK